VDVPQDLRPFEADRPTRQPTQEPADPPPVRHRHRPRDYGVGYGNSSGYGYSEDFVDGHVDPLFRCR
jgi:hypothetical protein